MMKSLRLALALLLAFAVSASAQTNPTNTREPIDIADGGTGATSAADAADALNTDTVIQSTGTPVSVTNTTTKTTVFTQAIPANSLGANGVLRLTIRSSWLNNSGGSSDISMQVDWGGVEISSLGVTGQGSSSNERAILFDLVLANQNATNSQYVSSKYQVSDPVAAGSDGNVDAADFRAAHEIESVDTTLAQTLTISVTNGVADAAITFTMRAAVLLRTR